MRGITPAAFADGEDFHPPRLPVVTDPADGVLGCGSATPRTDLHQSANQPLALTVTLMSPPLGVTGIPVMPVS